MRADLAALRPEALASLSSLGLLKRAQRMNATGLGPSAIEESAGGVVTARFGDGTVITLVPKRTLAQARCSCGAVFACRHGLSTVLAYQAQRGSPVPTQERRWNPGEHDDKELLGLIGKLGRARAGRMLRGGLVVKVGYEPHPTARLPTCTVRFLVPHELNHARCDCELGTACEHLYIAVRAFRQLGTRERATVELAASGQLDLAATRDARNLARELLWQGFAGAPESLDARLRRVRERLDADGQVWPVSLVDELLSALRFYRGRSARYQPKAAHVACELEARYRAARNATETARTTKRSMARDDAELPVGALLGTAESTETRLAELRLVSLGARVHAEDKTSVARVYLADVDTGNVLVLTTERTAKHKGASAPTTEVLATQELATGVRLVDAAYGQLLTQSARRRPSRALLLGGRKGRTQVSPEPGDWRALGTPTFVERGEALEEHLAGRPPTLLRPRVLAESVHVIPIAEVRGLCWSAGEQSLLADLILPGGERVRLQRQYRASAPHAIGALTGALRNEPTLLSGELRHGETGLVLDPIALRGPRGEMVVPDFESPAAPAAVPLGKSGAGLSPLAAALDLAAEALDEGAHRGLLAAPEGWSERLEGIAEQLAELGLRTTADTLARVAKAARRARSGGRSAAPETARLWMDARIRLSLAQEAVRC